jgi:uncharacterized protein YndB with AHSA1/START domain
MMTGTLTEIDGRPALRFERRLPHSPERVWRALADETADWFVIPVDWNQIDVTVWDPPRELAWNWESERYSFALSETGGGCVLVFTHVFNPDLGPAAQHAAGWEAYFDRLDALLGGERLGEIEAHTAAGERFERYAAAFGEDPARGRRHLASMPVNDLTLDDGPVLRLERRFLQPPERVWRALTDPGDLAHWFPSDAPMTVESAEPPRLLVASWFGDELRFELEPDERGGCTLRFSHAFADRSTAARTAAGWDRCFARLDARFAGASLSERDALELWPLVHERYAEAFGVDPALGRAAFEAHPLT